MLVRGPLPFDPEREGGPLPEDVTRFVSLDAVAKIAEHTRLEHLSSFSAFDLGVALVEGALLSAIAGKGTWEKARYGLLLDVSSERLYVLVSSATIGARPPDCETFDASELALRALDVVRSERIRY